MSHKRLHIRVPVSADVSLICEEAVVVEARAIDISAVGIRLATPGYTPSLGTQHEVAVRTDEHGTIRFKAELIHEGEYGAGYRITSINGENLRAIYRMINDFQGTEEFIHHIDQFCILEDWFVDENGDTLDVVFEER